MSTELLEAPKPTASIEIPLEGTYTANLMMVDAQVFPNYRKTLTEEHALQLFKEIKEHGQLTPCSGSWVKTKVKKLASDGKEVEVEESRIGIWSGFCRFEVMQRIALEKLVKEYNAANGKESPSDEGYIVLGGFGFDSEKNRRKIWEAGGEWREKYEAALRSYPINFFTKPVENQADAALKGISANTMDKPPLRDLCEKIEALMADKASGITQKKIARALAMSEGAVSQHRTIYAVGAYMRDMFTKGSMEELALKKPDEQQVMRDTLLTAVNEFERRISLPENHSESISFSHAREFSGAVMHKETPLSMPAVAKMLKLIVCMGEDGKIAKDSPPIYSVFLARLKEAKRMGKEEPAATPTQGGAATTAATPAGGATVATLTAEQQKQKEEFDKAAAAATATTTAAAVSTGKSAAPTPALSAEDQAKVAEVAAANADAPSTGATGAAAAAAIGDDEDISAILNGGSEVDLDGEGPAVVAPAVVTQLEDGQMKGKTGEAPAESKYNVKMPEKIEAKANKMFEFGEDARATLHDQYAYLLAGTSLFEAIGMQKQMTSGHEAYVNFGEKLNAYQAALENAVKEKLGEPALLELQKLRPVYVKPNLT